MLFPLLFPIKPCRSLLKMSSQELNYGGSEGCVKAQTIILFSPPVLLLLSGWEVLTVPPSTWQARKCFGQCDVGIWFQLATGPKYGYVHQYQDVIQFSTSVGKFYIMNPSKLPEGLLLNGCLQINFQRTDNSKCQNINQDHKIMCAEYEAVLKSKIRQTVLCFRLWVF